jgi:drug/metabolite transporter (DMT)-like permease
MAYFLFDEPMTGLTMAGIVITMAGVWLVTKVKDKEAKLS